MWMCLVGEEGDRLGYRTILHSFCITDVVCFNCSIMIKVEMVSSPFFLLSKVVIHIGRIFQLSTLFFAKIRTIIVRN